MQAWSLSLIVSFKRDEVGHKIIFYCSLKKFPGEMLIMSNTSLADYKVLIFILKNTGTDSNSIEIQKLIKRNMATGSNVM